jgi:hypothetical protein
MELNNGDLIELNELINLFLQATLINDFDKMKAVNVQLIEKMIILDDMLK